MSDNLQKSIDSKDLLVAIKAYSRSNPLPIDATSVWDSKSEAESYAKQGNAYAGQIISVKEGDKRKAYILEGESGNHSINPIGVGTGIKNDITDTSILINDVSDYSLQNIEVYGHCTQATTTGAQLLNVGDIGKTFISRDGNVTGIVDKDGIYTTIVNDVNTSSTNGDLYFFGNSNSDVESNYDVVPDLVPGMYTAYMPLVSDYRFYIVAWRDGANLILIDGALNAGKKVDFEVMEGDKFRIFLRPITTTSIGKTVLAQPTITKQTNNNISWETYTGGHLSPSPNYPQNIIPAGCNYNTGAQIFNVDDGETGWINDNGEFNADNAENYVSGFIPVKPGYSYCSSYDLSSYVFAYDKDKKFIAKKNYSTLFTVDDNVAFIRFALSSESDKALNIAKQIMINIGAIPRPYEPYTGGVLTTTHKNMDLFISNRGYVEKGSEFDVIKKIPLIKGTWIYLYNSVNANSSMNAFIFDNSELTFSTSSELYTYGYTRLSLTTVASSGSTITKNARLAMNWYGGVKYKIDADGMYLYYANNSRNNNQYYTDCYVWFSKEFGTKDKEYQSQKIIVSIPDGLSGIPLDVYNEGNADFVNHIDSSGQRWVCDSIDFARNKYIKRVRRIFNGR